MAWEPMRRGVAYHEIRHISCNADGEPGRRVVSGFHGSIYCEKCGLRWKMETWEKFTAEDLADRFEGYILPEEEKLTRVVWIEDGKKMYLGEIVGSSLMDMQGELEDGRKWRAFE